MLVVFEKLQGKHPSFVFVLVKCPFYMVKGLYTEKDARYIKYVIMLQYISILIKRKIFTIFILCVVLFKKKLLQKYSWKNYIKNFYNVRIYINKIKTKQEYFFQKAFWWNDGVKFSIESTHSEIYNKANKTLYNSIDEVPILK